MTESPVSPAPASAVEADAADAADEADELAALVEAGGFWRLVPEWVPRTGYAVPTRELLEDVAAGLRRRSAAQDRGRMDRGQEARAPIRSALVFPPCACPLGDGCPLRVRPAASEPEPQPATDADADAADDRSYSPTMRRLRPLVEEENRRRRRSSL